MANYLAIATVTAALQKMLQANVQVDLDGARVTTVRPGNVGSGVPETGVNIFLYDVLVNEARRNADLRPRQDSRTTRRSQAALDLYYLVSCYGNDVELEPQRLLGSVIRTFYSQPVFTKEMLQETISDPAFPHLANSDLINFSEPIAVTSLDLTLEDLSKMWSVFFQIPYVLSVAYKVSVIFVDAGESFPRALPVRSGRTQILPGIPTIQRVMALNPELVSAWGNEASQFVLPTSTLVITGQQLKAEVVQVELGLARIDAQEVTNTQIKLDISTVAIDKLQAGVQGLQVLHFKRQGTSLQPVSESNVTALVLRPTIHSITIANVRRDDDDCEGIVTLQVAPPVAKNQQVLLLLNERTMENAAAYTFDIPKLNEVSDTLTVPIKKVKAGEYFVRLRVDRADSLLTVDTQPNSETYEQYVAPLLRIA